MKSLIFAHCHECHSHLLAQRGQHSRACDKRASHHAAKEAEECEQGINLNLAAVYNLRCYNRWRYWCKYDGVWSLKSTQVHIFICCGFNLARYAVSILSLLLLCSANRTDSFECLKAKETLAVLWHQLPFLNNSISSHWGCWFN